MRWGAVCTAIAAIIGCSSAPTATAPAPTPTSATLPAPPKETLSPEAVAQAGLKTRGISCGQNHCILGQEMCCMGEPPTCVAIPPISEPDEQSEELGADQMAMILRAGACNDINGASDYRLCDDSSDCPGAERCCEQFAGSGADTFSECAASCHYGERCIGTPATASTCKAERSSCLDNMCALSPERLKCGGETCSATKPYCCGEYGQAPSCGSKEQCEAIAPVAMYGCHSSRDCPDGVCQQNLHGPSTYCVGAPDTANAAMVCERDDDCDPAYCVEGQSMSRCGPDKICECG